MEKSDFFSETLEKRFSVSRRTFIKTAAVGSAALAYGCSKNDGETIIMGGGQTILLKLR